MSLPKYHRRAVLNTNISQKQWDKINWDKPKKGNNVNKNKRKVTTTR